jgi:tetratricopeptide (TPR) repeat protein
VEPPERRCSLSLRPALPPEARIIFEAAAARAHEEQLYSSELRAMNNLGVVAETQDRFDESVDILDRMLVVARRRGDRRWESVLRTGAIHALFLLGRWDEGLAIVVEEEPLAVTETARMALLSGVQIYVERGDNEAARALLSPTGGLPMSTAPETVAGFRVAEARLLRAEGRPRDALEAAQRAVSIQGELDVTHLLLKMAFQEAVEAALEVDDLDAADDLLSSVEARDPGQLTPFLQASAARLRARLEAARGAHESVDSRFRSAAARYREFGLVFHSAVCALEHAEWLLGQGRPEDAEPLFAEASETFTRLRATPWLERLQRHADQVQPARQPA